MANGFLSRFMKAASKIEPHELRAVLISFLFVFTLMAGYYILRPVRDAMASDWTDTEVSFLWNLNFFVSMGVVALYGFAVSHLKFKVLVPFVYIFFAGSFIAFYFMVTGGDYDTVLVDKTFYVWVSVFSLFHVSVFWSFMSDMFSKEQAGRLFAFIAAGASAGALVGPAIPTFFATLMGNETLMLIAAAMITLVVPMIFVLERLKIVDLHNENVRADLSAARIGGNPLAGFKLFLTNKYLLGIGVFILLYTAIGSFVYFEQKNVLAAFDRDQRTQILGGLDLVVNLMTFVLGFFITSRIVTRFRMATTLALVPFFMAACMIVLAFAPVLTIVLAVQFARRAGNYGITRPAREMLFTDVDRETRFKAKPVIDIVVYRGGDAVSGTAFAGLTDGLGLGLGAVAAVGAGIAALWGAVGVFLGRVFDRRHAPDEAGVIDGPVAERPPNISR